MLKKVLVVNDNELLLMIAKKMITLSNFAEETITATNGLEAVEYFESLLENETDPSSKAPEFIFLDLHMPNMDGWEFLEFYVEKFSKHFPNLRIAILSASVDMQEMLMLVKYPVVIDFISTPINTEVLNAIEEKYYKLLLERA
ncbi:MAG: response regulator [Bacteroidota bacterium]